MPSSRITQLSSRTEECLDFFLTSETYRVVRRFANISLSDSQSRHACDQLKLVITDNKR